MKGITFKPELLSLIKSGLKTQTRRLAGLQKINGAYYIQKAHKTKKKLRWDYEQLGEKSSDFAIETSFNKKHRGFAGSHSIDTEYLDAKAQYLPDEVIYLKEKFKVLYSRSTKTKMMTLVEYGDGTRIWQEDIKYFHITHKSKFISSRFMPERYARDFIKIEKIKIQRIQDISNGDCIAEGIRQFKTIIGFHYALNAEDDFRARREKQSFELLWKSINPVESWGLNYFVFAYTFRLVVPEEMKKFGK